MVIIAAWRLVFRSSTTSTCFIYQFINIMQIIISSGELMHTASKGSKCRVPSYVSNSYIYVCSTRHRVIWIKNCSKNTSATKVAIMKIQIVLHTPVKGATPINYYLKNKYTLHLVVRYVCLNCYTAAWIKTSTSVIKVAFIDNFHYVKEAITCNH